MFSQLIFQGFIFFLFDLQDSDHEHFFSFFLRREVLQDSAILNFVLGVPLDALHDENIVVFL